MIKNLIPFVLLMFFNQLYAKTADTTQAGIFLEQAVELIDALKFQEALQLTDSALLIYQTATDTLPQLGLAYNVKGDAIFEIGDYQEALTCYIIAKKILSNHYGHSNADVAQAYNNIGRCHMATENIYAAAENYQKALEIRVALFGTHHSKVADSFNNLGNCALYLGALPGAYQYYGQALDIRIQLFGRQHIDVASSLLNLGYCQIEVKDYRKAIPFFLESLQIRQDSLGAFHPKIVQNCQNLGDAYIQLEKIDTAIIYLNQALAIFAHNQQENHPDVAKIYTGFGNAYTKLGNYNLALGYFEKALQIELQQFQPDSYRLFPVYNALADTYAESGDYKKALTYYQNNLHILHEHVESNHAHLGLTHNNMGKTLQKTGDFETALAHYNQAISIFKTLDDQHSLGMIYNNIGNCFWEDGQAGVAIPIYQRSLAIFEDLYGEEHIENAAIHYNLGNCLAKEKDYKTAHIHYEKAIELTQNIYHTTHPLLAKYKTSKGTVYQEQGKYQAALTQFEEALAILKVKPKNKQGIGFIESPIVLIDLLNAKANTLYLLFASTEEQAYLLESLTLYEYAIELIKSLRKQYQEEASQRLLGEKGFTAFSEAIRTCYALFQLTNEEKYKEIAFAYSEQSRNTVLLSALNTNAAAQFSGIPDSLITKELALKTTITFYEKKWYTENSHGKTADLDLLDELGNKIFTKKQQYATLIKQFENQFPAYFQLKYADHTITIPTIQKELLATETALVEYFVADSMVYIFVIDATTTHFEGVKINDLIKKVQLFRTGIYTPHTNNPVQSDSTYLSYLQQYATTAHYLYQYLWQPIADKLPQKVRIINGGVLNLLPFEALLVEAPERLDRQKSFHYLLKDNELSYGYSATLLHQIENGKAANFSKRLLAFAPEFVPADSSLFTPLLHNIPEVAAIQQLLQGDIYTGSTASRQTFLDHASAYQIIHLATHGKADANIGDYSYLAFTATPDTTKERLLYAKDIYNLSLNAEMIVLSACETGDGEFFKGEGVISLGSAFFYAGAKSIVSTLWSVDDASTKKLVEYFYHGIKAGQTKSAALRQAKLQYLEQTNYPHPFYWAAFVGNGDMKAIPPVAGLWTYFLGFLGLGVFLFLGFIWWRRKRLNKLYIK